MANYLRSLSEDDADAEFIRLRALQRNVQSTVTAFVAGGRRTAPSKMIV